MLPRFLQPSLAVSAEGASLAICSGCQLTSDKIKWKYPTGRGCACWCCGNTSVGIMEEEEENKMSWSEVVPYLHSFKGTIFVKFCLDLDAALMSYSKG